jgi:hypothetical protein
MSHDPLAQMYRDIAVGNALLAAGIAAVFLGTAMLVCAFWGEQ